MAEYENPISYNELLTQSEEFVAVFQDHDGFATIVRTIRNYLMNGILEHVDSPNNPINRYATDEDDNDIMARLRSDVHASLDNANHQHYQGLLVAFFSPGGVYYDMLSEFMDAYLEYADNLRDIEDQNNQNEN